MYLSQFLLEFLSVVTFHCSELQQVVGVSTEIAIYNRSR